MQLFKVISIFVVTFLVAFNSSADVLENVKANGKLVVGVKADYKPYGFRNDAGELVGIEPALAKEVADKLGVALELVPVIASNRIEFLKQGKIDLMIATMSDNEKRRALVEIVEPNYYSSGANILAIESAQIEDWKDLKNKPVCAVQGAYYNKTVRQLYKPKILPLPGTVQALDALSREYCVAFLYDDSYIVSTLNEPEWQDGYEMPLETIEAIPWGIAVAKGEKAFAQFLAEMIVDWHKRGRILELERQYNVPNTAFLKEMHARYREQ